MLRLFVITLLAAAVTGCAFTPQAVTIAPTVDVASSQVGHGKELALNVVDERPKKTLGTVGVGNVGADISVEGDIVASVQRALSDGLSRLSFKPSSRHGAGPSELRVEIRNLDYTIIRGFWAGTLRVDAGLKGICMLDGRRPYEKLHHGEFVESIQVVQPQEANNQYINKAMSAAVNSLLSDHDLMTCLAQQKG